MYVYVMVVAILMILLGLYVSMFSFYVQINIFVVDEIGIQLHARFYRHFFRLIDEAVLAVNVFDVTSRPPKF